MRLRHQKGSICPSCEEKLREGHPTLGYAFHTLKEHFPEVHLSWVFRDQVYQDQAYIEGKSKLKWPQSSHNAMRGKKPCSRAMDLFRLMEDGTAHFEEGWYKLIWKLAQELDLPLLWGGNFLTLADSNHFQLTKDVP